MNKKYHIILCNEEHYKDIMFRNKISIMSKKVSNFNFIRCNKGFFFRKNQN